ncbi:T-cell surface glycoprotein CD5 [Carettochelys insculpta]|uniref:T-cell surface glycoprotein CD5 n=1 Tax=Carettochelys insculpta TaxID=44489 RepID=UPI003EBB9853
MGVQPPALILLILVGMWVTSCHGGKGKNPAAVMNIKVVGSDRKCLGLLKVYTNGWKRVCGDPWNQEDTAMICKHLGCDSFGGEVLKQDSVERHMEGMKMVCQGNETDSSSCFWEKSNCTKDVIVICKDLRISTVPPTPSPTTPEPTGPPRLRLVDGRFSCSGTVELYMEGQWGTVQSHPENKQELARWVCRNVGCGDALDEENWASFMKDERQHLPVRWEMLELCTSDSIQDCFNRTRNSHNKPPASVICSNSQPRVMQRLVNSQSPCEGIMEVFHNGSWDVLCDSSSWRKSRGEKMCQALRCGSLSSIQVKDTQTRGVSCNKEDLQDCLPFQKMWCSKTRFTCQPHSAVLGAGTIMSILLALILLGVLIVICGPPAYRKLQKKYTKKKQRQWIGPTGLQQNVSFHRNSTVTLRPRLEGPGVQGEDNDYSQTPQKNSYLSAYPALEGAIRSSNPPDNSSDSDYDFHSARRV